MPIGNIVALGFILTFFGTFMAVLAWGAWYTSTPIKPRRPARAAMPPRAKNDGELAPIRIQR